MPCQIKVTLRATPVQKDVMERLRKNPDAYIREVWSRHYEILGAPKRIAGLKINPAVDWRTIETLLAHGKIIPCNRVRNARSQIGWILAEGATA